VFYGKRLARIEAKLDEILARIKTQEAQEKTTMTIIDDAFAALNAKLKPLTDAAQANETLLTGIKAQLDAALAVGDPTKIVAQVQAVSDAIAANTASLVANTLANTPAAPPPTP
jgi:predicted rRNA methylase YqxC with S4 and FtsJ domains